MYQRYFLNLNKKVQYCQLPGYNLACRINVWRKLAKQPNPNIGVCVSSSMPQCNMERDFLSRVKNNYRLHRLTKQTRCNYSSKEKYENTNY